MTPAAIPASPAEVAKAVENGAEALFGRLRPNGAFGYDAPASILGTAGAIAALHAHDPKGEAKLVDAGAAWLREQQLGDGGWGGVVGAPGETVPTAVATAALAMTAAADSADAIKAGRERLAALGGVGGVHDRAIALLCRQLLAMAGLTEEAGQVRRLPLEIVHFDAVRRRAISFRTAPFIGLALMQDGLLPAGRLRAATLRRARPKAISLLRSIYDHEGRSGAFSEDPWPAALVLLGLARSGEAPDMAEAIAGWLRGAVRADGSWDAVTNLDLTRSGYAATGLITAGYRDDPRLRPTRELFHATQKKESFDAFAVPPGGWSFSNARGWPVTLESAEILTALAGFPEAADDPALRSGLAWLLDRQDKRGSWSLWVRDTKLPNDGPCPAITAQAITALREAGHQPDHPAVSKAARWLQTRQQPDGTFESLWYRDHTSGTAVVVAALSKAGMADSDTVTRAVAWLTRTQLPDGSWGPGDETEGSVEETAWAVEALLNVPGADGAVERGVAWLVDAALPDGSWRPTRVCNYIRHYMHYSNSIITQGLALRALGEYRARREHSESGRSAQ
jgi:squalene-hopene/tetraprenyl-beta-curcumene cyclase